MVFAGLYPIEDTDYEGLRDALEKLRLNDSAFSFEPETSLALGYGFRCGFLGMLHLEIVQERLEREFNLSLIVTAPSVRFKVLTTQGEMLEVENPSRAALARPHRAHGGALRAGLGLRAHRVHDARSTSSPRRSGASTSRWSTWAGACTSCSSFPLSEIVVDFYDRLKSVSKGYASFDYEFLEFRESELVKLDILLNGDPVDALSIIVHRDKAYEKGKALAEKLRAVIPRQLYEVAIQAAIGSRVIARETVKAMGKNVTAKCYGGDITRKRKLLEKQKEGKKRMKQVGQGRGSAGGVPVGAQELSGATPPPPMASERDPDPARDAATSAPPVTRARRKSLVREYGEAIVVAVLLALVIRAFVVQAFTIPSGSMMDTLLIGDYILVNKFLYGPEIPFTDTHLPGFRDPVRGDIIVFKYPNDESRDFIKRIVAIGGETVQVRDNRVFVNGQRHRGAATCALGRSRRAPSDALRLPLRVRADHGARRAPTSSWATTGTTPRTAGTGASSSARRSAARPS